MTTMISLDSLRDLAAFRAERGSAVSLYVDLDPSLAPTAGDVQARVNSLLDRGENILLRTDLGHERRLGVRSDLDRLARFFTTEFDRDGANGFAAFAAGLDDVWTTMALAEPVPDAIRIGDEFALTPLVPLVGRGDGALAVIVNRGRGTLYRLRGGKLVELADLTEDAPRRHDQGGWAQARLQRHVDKVAQDHYRAVADELDRRFRALQRPRVVIVCNEDERGEIAEALSSEVADAVVGWTTAQAHASAPELAEVVVPLLERWRARCESEYVERWREEAGRGGRATAGWNDTLEAASDGRVELLLYRDGVTHAAVRCPECGRVQLAGGDCPLDGTRLEPTPDGLELAVRHTLAHGGAVWAVEHRPDLDVVEGIGALRRF